MKPTVILTAALLCALSPISFAKPLKVFILSGQSNMQGHANTSTFDYIGKDPLTAPILAVLPMAVTTISAVRRSSPRWVRPLRRQY